MSTRPHLHAYDYGLDNENKHISYNEYIYDSLRRNNSNMFSDSNSEFVYENDTINSQSKVKRNSKISKKSRSRSNDETQRKKISRNSNLNVWEDTAEVVDSYGTVCSIPINRNFSGHIYQNRNYDEYLESYEISPVTQHISPQINNESDFYPNKWTQWSWSPTVSYCSPLALSPSSPLDSGLSSQSLASSPSLETESIHFRKFSECGSPITFPYFQKNQCSCSTTSFSDPSVNIVSPITRSDSGRSSPWNHSSFSRPNTFTQTKKLPYSSDHPLLFDILNTHGDFENKRFSMSGIYISLSNKKHSQTSKTLKGIGNEIDETSIEKNRKHQRSIRSEEPEYYSISKVGTYTSPVPEFQRKENMKNKKSEINVGKNKINYGDYQRRFDTINSPSKSMDVYTQTNAGLDSDSPIGIKNKYSHSEKALCELEDMYNKLNLHDYDLLDRAERRDLPTIHQDSKLQNKISNLTRSKSDSCFEILGSNFCHSFEKFPRAPPSRRSGVPDLIADDMAIRKQQKSSSKPLYMLEYPTTYMLCSSHFTPSLPISNEILLNDRPDIEYDDLSYRKYYHISSGKESEPQPPFGIPLKPLPPQSIFSDYLHVVPSQVPPPLCHPRGNPDLVRDDLAYRSLRKDDPERALYDSYSLFYRKVQ